MPVPFLLALALLAQAPAAEPASDPVTDAPTAPVVPAEERLAAAAEKLRALDDTGARDALAPLVDDPTVGEETRIKAALLLGQARANLGESERASDAFMIALGLRPAITLPADATDAARAAFERARTQLAARQPPPAALPAKQENAQEPVLQWMRPTSYVLMGAGALVLVAGAATVVAGFVAREYARRLTDPVQIQDVTRLYIPIAVLAGTLLVLSVPIAGTGLAMFFLGSPDGPLRDKLNPQPAD